MTLFFLDIVQHIHLILLISNVYVSVVVCVSALASGICKDIGMRLTFMFSAKTRRALPGRSDRQLWRSAGPAQVSRQRGQQYNTNMIYSIAKQM